MKIIGITGASGSGKTTASEILSKREDVRIIDADKVAKSLNLPGTDYMLAIENAFGKDVFHSDGNLNRKKLASLIYREKESREMLNSLTFKYVVDEILKKLEIYKKDNINFIVIDAALLIESGLDKYCDIIVALVAEDDLKVKRMCKRDNIDEETAISRLKIQHNNEYYIKRADYCIENSKNYDLKSKIEEVLDHILKKYKSIENEKQK